MTQDTGGYLSSPLVARLYDQVIPYRDRPDVDFFVQAAVDSGGPVLEVGCGTGRVLLPTARAGIAITGLDLSEYMLDVCRAALKEEPNEVQKRVNLIQGDMRYFDLQTKFNLVTTPFRPFQHLETVEDQVSCLRCINRHLEHGGLMILDIFNPSLAGITADTIGKEVGAEPEFTTPEGIKVRRFNKTNSRDHFKQVLDVELIYYLTHPDGREERLVHAFKMRYLFRYEAEHLLARCGFEVLELYADYQKNPYGSISPGELIFLARKI
ncbi:MAG: class I SAM-dependent methyltransferase [Anaerolineales bacterium]|nr:class I SAM-dependent methyltransferase [Anaerolineales bacterium]